MDVLFPSIAVVIPTLNEEGMIQAVVLRALSIKRVSWVIVVDDSSTDATVEIVRSLQRSDPRVCLVVRRGKPRSFARSYVDGFRCALRLGAEALIQMDGDGSHDPGDIPCIIEALRRSDVVVCSRYAPGGENHMHSSLRHLLSYAGSRFSQAILKVPVRDMTGGFNGWNARVIRTIRFEDNRFEGFGFQVWLKWKAYTSDFNLTELPTIFREREFGHSKFRFSMALEVLLGMVKMRSETSSFRHSSLRSNPPNSPV